MVDNLKQIESATVQNYKSQNYKSEDENEFDDPLFAWKALSNDPDTQLAMRERKPFPN